MFGAHSYFSPLVGVPVNAFETCHALDRVGTPFARLRIETHAQRATYVHTHVHTYVRLRAMSSVGIMYVDVHVGARA